MSTPSFLISKYWFPPGPVWRGWDGEEEQSYPWNDSLEGVSIQTDVGIQGQLHEVQYEATQEAGGHRGKS